MPYDFLFAQIKAALSDTALQGLELLEVLAAFVTDSGPSSRADMVKIEDFCGRVDKALQSAIYSATHDVSNTYKLQDVANAMFLICMGASGLELRTLFYALGASGSLGQIVELTGDASIAEITVGFEKCVCFCGIIHLYPLGVVLLFTCPIHAIHCQPTTCSFNIPSIPFMANHSLFIQYPIHSIHGQPIPSTPFTANHSLFIQYPIHSIHGQPLTLSFNIPSIHNHMLVYHITNQGCTP